MFGVGGMFDDEGSRLGRWMTELSAYSAAHPQVQLAAAVFTAIIVAYSAVNLAVFVQGAIAARRRGVSYWVIFESFFVPMSPRRLGSAVLVWFGGRGSARGHSGRGEGRIE